MKFKKKSIISILMVLTILITGSFSHANVNTAPLYKDTTALEWYYGSLDVLSQENIITGFTDGTFKGNQKLTIDQYIAILCRLTGNDVGVSDGYWATNYIAYAKNQGWLDGVSYTIYNTPIDRYEASRLTIKAMNLVPNDYPDEFLDYSIYINDFNIIPQDQHTTVLLSYALGIITGYPDSTFSGNNTLTRAEAAVISHRVFDPKVRKLALSPSKAKALAALFASNPGLFAGFDGEMTLINNQLVFIDGDTTTNLSNSGLDPNVGNITENILADALIDHADDETDNTLSAGYNYGVFNINLLTEDNESLVILDAQDGQKVIILDLVLMQDTDGNLKPGASEFILLVCKNIDFDNASAMHNFIITNYNNRASLPSSGVTTTYGSTDLRMTALVHDHNVVKVEFTLN
ncbi:S-layer homology domain-containing protein [Petrocella sp. FN5]|uniref:S-layer homology domain-containing protein n=1 Tax=Petrocella sp. FN5 TaxID=3032002 RepID=UPI0023DB2E03|nr:S-layer homology domain-containing protein [Petrocella sp. FN5]MDF1617558.1 S-layer homology domain-containing protein [Petrocella sp. FN5]